MNFKTLCLLIAMIFAGLYCLKDFSGDKTSPTPPDKVVPKEQRLSESSRLVQTNDEFSFDSSEDVKPVVLFFYTDWCGGCKRFKPTYYAVKHKVAGYRYVEINADKNDGLSNHFNIRSIPTVYIYDKKNNYKGKVNINNFERELRKYLENRK